MFLRLLPSKYNSLGSVQLLKASTMDSQPNVPFYPALDHYTYKDLVPLAGQVD